MTEHPPSVYVLPDGRKFTVPHPYYLGSCDACASMRSGDEVQKPTTGTD